MRKSADIRKDLKAQIEAVRAMDATADKAAYDAAVQKAVDFAHELDSATKVEEAEQRLAEKQRIAFASVPKPFASVLPSHPDLLL